MFLLFPSLAARTDTAGGFVQCVIESDGSWRPSKWNRLRARVVEPTANQPVEPTISIPDSYRYLGRFVPSFLP